MKKINLRQIENAQKNIMSEKKKTNSTTNEESN